jgi:hypothetical protein
MQSIDVLREEEQLKIVALAALITTQTVLGS